MDNRQVRALLVRKRDDSLACSHGVSSELLWQLLAAQYIWQLIMSCLLTCFLFAWMLFTYFCWVYALEPVRNWGQQGDNQWEKEERDPGPKGSRKRIIKQTEDLPVGKSSESWTWATSKDEGGREFTWCPKDAVWEWQADTRKVIGSPHS